MKRTIVLLAGVLSCCIGSWAESALAQTSESCPQVALDDIGQRAYIALRYETVGYTIFICEVRSGGLYLYSTPKGVSSEHITVPAAPTGQRYEYVAKNGSTRYVVNPRNGYTKIEGNKVVLRENLYSWLAQPMPNGWRDTDNKTYKGRDFKPGAVAQVNRKQVNVRSRPNENSKVITRLNRGTSVDVLRRENNSTDGYIWYRIVIPQDGERGWIRGDLLRPA
ncbi:MAG: SH3 domain-containing protein [Microcoleaceae cyanobacterium]